jgi:hypothetical protein
MDYEEGYDSSQYSDVEFDEVEGIDPNYIQTGGKADEPDVDQVVENIEEEGMKIFLFYIL